MGLNDSGQWQDQGPQAVVPQQHPAAKKSSASPVLLGIIVVLVAALATLGIYAYKWWSGMKKVSESAESLRYAFQESAAQASQQLSPQTNRIMVADSDAPNVSGQGDIPRTFGQILQKAPEVAGKAPAILNALSKYKDRPIVQEFLKDLNSNPEFKKIWDGGLSKNPAALFSNPASMNTVIKTVELYVRRPEFVALLAEIYSDPELSQVAQSIQGLLMPAMPFGQPPSGNAMYPAPGTYSSGGSDGAVALGSQGGAEAGSSAQLSGVSAKKSGRRKVPPPVPGN